MREKDYFEAMDRLHAPDSAVDRAVQAALKADGNRKEITMKEKHRMIRRIGLTAAAAACLAVCITLTAVFSHQNRIVPSFVLTANAAELEKDHAVNILSAATYGGTMGFNQDYVSMTEEIKFDIRCKGENIRAINYRVHHGIFILPAKQKLMEEGTVRCAEYSYQLDKDIGDLSAVPIGDGLTFHDMQNGQTVTGGSLYSAFTVSYDEQPDILAELDTAEDVEDYEKNPPVQISVGITSEDETLSETVRSALRTYGDRVRSTLDDTGEQPYIGMEESDKNAAVIYDALLSNVTIDAVITYEDGHTEQCEIQLSCEGVKDGAVSIGARLI